MKTENNTQQLPAEVVAEIDQTAQLLMDFLSNDESVNDEYLKGYKQGIKEGATEYATKLLHEEKKNDLLEEALEHWNKKATGAIDLLKKFISRHEAGLLPDRFIYDEIKNFLDGTK